MPETIDLLLKELKLPAFSRYYQLHHNGVRNLIIGMLSKPAVA